MLIWVDASNLPRLGITDWKHIQVCIVYMFSHAACNLQSLCDHSVHLQSISAKVREMLGIEEPYWNKSITLPPRCEMGIFLERKSFTGKTADRLTFRQTK